MLASIQKNVHLSIDPTSINPSIYLYIAFCPSPCPFASCVSSLVSGLLSAVCSPGCFLFAVLPYISISPVAHSQGAYIHLSTVHRPPSTVHLSTCRRRARECVCAMMMMMMMPNALGCVRNLCVLCVCTWFDLRATKVQVVGIMDHGSWIRDAGALVWNESRTGSRAHRASVRSCVRSSAAPPPPRRAPGLYSPSGTVSSSYGTFGTDTDTFRYFASLPPVRGTRSPPLAFAAVRSSLESGLCALLARSLHCTGWR